MFSAPSARGDRLPEADVVGHLLIIRPVEHVASIPTDYGDKDAIRVDVVDLDTPDLSGTPGVVSRDVLWFAGRLVGSLKRQIGELVLARIELGTPKKRNEKPPYQLVDATDDPAALARASAWMAAHPEFVAGTAPEPRPAPAAVSVAAPAPAPTATAVPAPAVPVAAAPVQQIPAALLAQLDPATRALYDQLAAQQRAAG